ncbi:hypothetical protein KCP78_11625 [Salmonella enterica subsp. enterica]|nr:hypothetical protein KCP78_11625 [Salmonella enterica subsp. enterica]
MAHEVFGAGCAEGRKELKYQNPTHCGDDVVMAMRSMLTMTGISGASRGVFASR